MSSFKTIDQLRAEVVKYRRRKGLSRDIFAELSGVPATCVSNFERGKNVRSDTLAAICDAIGLELNFKREGEQ